MPIEIVNDRIDGTRITVYDVFYYVEKGWEPNKIAEILRLSPDELEAARRYIDEHRAEVLEGHKEIEERNARGNPPEILAKLQVTRAKMDAWLKERLEVV